MPRYVKPSMAIRMTEAHIPLRLRYKILPRKAQLYILLIAAVTALLLFIEPQALASGSDILQNINMVDAAPGNLKSRKYAETSFLDINLDKDDPAPNHPKATVQPPDKPPIQSNLPTPTGALPPSQGPVITNIPSTSANNQRPADMKDQTATVQQPLSNSNLPGSQPIPSSPGPNPPPEISNSPTIMHEQRPDTGHIQPHETISKEKWDKHDISMLEGCWVLGQTYISGYMNREGGPRVGDRKVFAEKLCFNKGGRGRQFIKHLLISGPGAGNRTECTIPIIAKFSGSNEVVFETERKNCGNFIYLRNSVVCVYQTVVQARCKGVYKESDWRIFRRED